MEYPYIAENIFDCSSCPNPCDGISKGVYIFEDDVELSEYYERKIIDYIHSKGVYQAEKTKTDGYPDIEVRNGEGNIKVYIEVKVQQRTFMKISTLLPEADLCPSETIALNLSDLKRYFEVYDRTQKPIYVVWVLLKRSCIVGDAGYKVYAQKIEVLRDIYQDYLEKRKFKRNSGEGDMDDNKHKGVVLNYHFILNDLKPWDINL
ncbi:MAG TPA: hypothetical protein PKA53_00845 [Sphingobacterium sp.]|nr:hypothetical protein [Sphingobacterium sp.]